MKPTFCLFDQRQRLLIDLTHYIDSCQLTSIMDYVKMITLGQPLEEMIPIKQNYQILVTGYNSAGVSEELLELSCKREWFWFEYGVDRWNMDDCLFGKAYVTFVSNSVSNQKWYLELVCTEVCRGRISKKEHKVVMVIKQGRRIAREG